mgnify:CR=1 FL=1
MDNPKVSIIVPIYRVEEYIERCAESLFAQTFDDIRKSLLLVETLRGAEAYVETPSLR